MLHEYFTTIDWLVVFGYLALTTWVGHKMSGSQASIKDFFLGGRSLPWQAVTGSIIATEISGVTFIGVPGVVFALTGNFAYLQWAIGSVIARIIVGYFFVKVYYEQEIYSPYDYMGNRLGKGVKRLATLIFSIGSILGQSVRVLVAALALDVVTPLAFHHCIWVIGLFAICWTLMGGMRAVIWTDVMQFALFTIGGSVAFFWITTGLDGGIGQFFKIAGSVKEAGEHGKFTLLSLSTDPRIAYTLWVAIIAVPFQNLSAFGVDQLNAQRMFCCRSAADAKKAIIWSSVGQFLTLLMLLVGAALFVYYAHHGISPAEAEQFAKESNYVFPAWITTTLPVGLRGLILAGIFAAAISSLDSILAALSQTTLALFVKPEDVTTDEAHRKLVRTSRILVVCWGIGLSWFAIILDSMRGEIDMVMLAFGMAAYTAGPMLGLFLAAMLAPRSSGVGLGVGVLLSFLLVMYVKNDLHSILEKKGVSVEKMASWGAHTVKQPTTPIIDASSMSSLSDQQWKTVIVRGTVEGIVDAAGEGLEAYPTIKLKGSDLKVFIGSPEKGEGTRDLSGLRTSTIGKEIMFKSQIFTNDGAEQLSALVALKKGTQLTLVGDIVDPSATKIAGNKILKPNMTFAWMYPITCILTLGCGILGGFFTGKRRGEA